ncbi:MAG: response regulator [Tenuifilum sp.]|jgi:DNA-binding response OmpR family regulator|uniref:response regulator n=1 Tax=Tenuifilum sp. TaxID=2760880 RepID=UPI001B533D22|nr:response regulator [Bacteroidales bacterium]HOK60100.1 response regulator [Tenuifilum sp.]MBP9029484.1 response regulator [Bacteroidales bacterium]HOK84980.1 response regulator [Tenuifilum sp.]HON69537.1 response regulator [Tenuifilum sp.]
MANSRKTILIVDDDTDYLFQLKFHVEKMGFDVVTAESQREAENILKNIKPDLAILDLMMENEDSGFILSYKLKRMYPDVPVIIATAVSAETGMSFGISSEQERQWIKADLYLEKGIRPDQLHREILKLLKV